MERKVILNRCFGGYSWSKQGVIEVLKEKGLQGLRFWVLSEQMFALKMEIAALLRHDKKFFYKEVTEAEFLEDNSWDWHITVNNEQYDEGSCFDENDYCWHGFDREDPDAIKVLEERGSKFCSGVHAELKIDSFDDEFFGYRIDEYDGSEDLEIFPQLTKEQVLNCNSVSEVADILEKIGVIKKPA